MFDEDGFVIKKNFLTEKEINSIRFLTSDYEYPYSKIKSLKFSHVDFDFQKRFMDVGKSIRGKNLNIYMRKVYHKNAFVGAHEGFHQDFFYKQYHGLDNKNFLQCFVALDNLYYAPLNVFKGSHKLGLQDHVKVLERDGNAKFIISPKTLASLENEFLALKLEKGDAIFFDYLLIHGSGSNPSPFNQKRMVVELASENINIKTHGFDRKEFEKQVLSNMLSTK